MEGSDGENAGGERCNDASTYTRDRGHLPSLPRPVLTGPFTPFLKGDIWLRSPARSSSIPSFVGSWTAMSHERDAMDTLQKRLADEGNVASQAADNSLVNI